MTFRSAFEHKDDLLRAAIDEFSQRGCDAASINRVLAASDVSKGQLYHHFVGKEGLYLGLVEWMIDQRAAWIGAQGVLPTADDGFFATLRGQMQASLDFAAAHPDVDRFRNALLAERGRPIFDAVVKHFGFDADSALDSLVAMHHALGAFRSTFPLEFDQRICRLVINHGYELLDAPRASDAASMFDDLVDFLRHGLSSDRGPRGR